MKQKSNRRGQTVTTRLGREGRRTVTRLGREERKTEGKKQKAVVRQKRRKDSYKTW